MEQEKEIELLKDLEELDKLKRIDRTIDDFYLFVNEYFQHELPVKIPEFHKEIYDLLNRSSKNPINKDYISRVLVIAPRGFAKSTLSSRFFPLFLALTMKVKHIVITSATASLAKEHLRFIRQELETNEMIIKDYGEQKGKEKWTEDHIILNNGVVIYAKGRGFQIRGFRFDVVICDDLEDEEVIYSKEQRAKMESWFFRELMPALKPYQRLIYIGTILHQFSLLNKLREKEEFSKLFYKALVNERSIWEEQFPTSYLLKLRTEIGVYPFEAEYMNNPLSMEEQPIKPHMLDVVKSTKPVSARCLAVDPAISEKEVADYSALTIYDRHSDNTFSLNVKRRGHWGIDRLVDEIIDMYQTYKPDRVLLEEVAYQKVIRYVLTEKSRKMNLFIPISTAEIGMDSQKGDKRPKDKVTRLLQILKLFEQKLVYIGDEETKQEMLMFPFGEHDDLVDASVYALYWLMKFNQGGVFRKSDGKYVAPTVPSLNLKQTATGEFIVVSEPPVMKAKSNIINTTRKIK